MKIIRGCVGVLASLALTGVLSGCDSFTSTETRIQRAKQAMAAGQTNAAVIEIKNVLDAEPANNEARLVLVELSLLQADIPRARAELDKLMAAGVRTPWTAELMARVRLEQGEGADVLKQLDSHELNPDEPARTYLRGRALMQLKRPAEAKPEFERALAADPAYSDARTALADVLVGEGRSDDALKLLEEGIAGGSAKADAYLMQGEILRRRGQNADAEAVLAKARSLPPARMAPAQRASLLALLTDVQLSQGKVEQASPVQRELASMAPEWPMTRFMEARIALARNDYNNATNILQKLVQAAPEFAQARLLLGIALSAQGNLRQAESQLAWVVDRAPENVEARKLLARLRLQLENPESALRALGTGDDAVADPQLLSLAGAAYFQAGDRDQGIGALEKAARAQPTNVGAQLDLARAYLSARQFSKATSVLQPLPALAGGAMRERLLLTTIGIDKGPQAARAALDKMLAEKGSDPQMLYVAAAFYAAQGEFDAARSSLRRVIAQNPKDGRALAGLGEIELRAGNAKEAEGPLNEAAKVSPKDPAIQFALAQFYLLQHDATRAKTALDNAVALAPNRADLVNAAGRLLLSAQQFDQALDRFRRAVEIEPNRAVYWVDVARAQLAQGQAEAARESIGKALGLQPDYSAAEKLLVMVELRAGGAKPALARVQDMRRRNPRDAEVAMLEGDVRMASREYSDAVRAYADAEKLKPSSVLALKTHEALRAGGLENPQAPLQSWLTLHPEDVPVRLVLSSYLQQTKQWKSAQTELETLTRLAPKNAAVLNNLAWVYQMLSDKRALDTARIAHELAPENPSIADTYGWLLMRNGQATTALPLLEKAAQGVPNDPEIRYHHAAVLAANGDKGKAREILRSVLAAQSDFAERRDAERLLAELES